MEFKRNKTSEDKKTKRSRYVLWLSSHVLIWIQSTNSLMKIVMELADNHFGLGYWLQSGQHADQAEGRTVQCSSNPRLLQAERCVPQVKEKERPTCNVHEREAHRWFLYLQPMMNDSETNDNIAWLWWWRVRPHGRRHQQGSAKPCCRSADQDRGRPP